MTVALLAVFILPASAEKRTPRSSAEIKLSFAPLVKKAAPAVVNIFTKKTVTTRRFSPLFDDPFFKRFFGENFGGGGSSKQRRVQNTLGSGVIIRPNGLIITNHHVIQGADQITVVLADRREFDAKIVGSDEGTDLAVLKITSDGEKFSYLRFRDSDDLEVGDLVLAIGNPFGVGQTVTSGIVSALARTQVGVNDLNFFIQTDAAINPGNSGGALITMDGRLVGVNSAIYSKSGGSVGIGFAIPSNMVKSVVASLTTNGKLVRPWFGGVGQTVSSDIAASIGLKRPAGILISKLYPNGPAARAGIRIGDVILSIDGKRVNDPGGLRFRLATRQIGRKSKLVIYRRGKRKTLNFPVEAPPRTPHPEITELSGVHPLQGATVANLSPALAEEIGVDVMLRGVVVLQVRRGGAANRFGFKPGDIMREINGKPVKSVGALQLDLKHDVSRWRIEIIRDGKILSMSVNR